jgi:hypothetical protein
MSTRLRGYFSTPRQTSTTLKYSPSYIPQILSLIVFGIQSILAAHNTIRVPRANMVLRESTLQGARYETYEPGLPNEKEDMKARFENRFEKIWNYDIVKEMDKVLEGMYGFA